MADKGARSKPALSSVNTHKLARRRSTDTKMKAPNLIKKSKVEAQMVNRVDIRIAAAFQSAISLVGHLYAVLPPSETSLVHEVLIKLLLNQDSTLRGKVTEHARRQLSASYDMHQVIDWTGLDVPAHICQAVWQFHCMEKLLHD